MSIIFFDTETNGLPKDWKASFNDLENWPRIIQFAYQVVDQQGNVLKDYKELIQPDQWEIPKKEFWIKHGYSDAENMAKGIALPLVLKEFLEDYNKATEIVAHNMNFDFNVLAAELLRYNLRASVRLPKTCTMLSSIDFCQLKGPYGYKYPSLDELHKKLFKKGFDGAHDAGYDVIACRDCYFGLKKAGIPLKQI